METVRFRSGKKSCLHSKGCRSLLMTRSLDLFPHKRVLFRRPYFHEARAFQLSFSEHERQVHLTVPQWSLCNRLVWNQEKLLQRSPDQEAGKSTLKPQALATMQRDGKTNSPTGKRKNSFGMRRKKGPWARNTCFHLTLWLLAFLHVLP